MTTRRRKAVLLALVLLAGFVGVWKLEHQIAADRATLYQEEDDLVLRSGPTLRIMSLEYAPLLADVYWTRVVQYYGGKQARQDANIALLWPLLDVTTTLDPHLIVAYRFGSMFLSQAPPMGAGRPDLAIELIKRGIRENPDYWRFYEDLGFIYYFELKDYQKAAEAFLEGSKKPGAMIWMKTFAAKIAQQGGTRELAAQLWSEVYDSATDPTMKKNALMHLKLLKADSDCEQLDLLVEAYQKGQGRRPGNLHDLVAAGSLRGIPVDPEGYPYTLSAEGKAQLNPASPLFRQKTRIP
jgi:tetratricopeptide (TPR) repeat protein